MNLSYLYIYDRVLSQPRYNKILSRLETKLLELGIKGRITRLTPLKNLKEIVDEATRQGAQTVVAVGGDEVFSQIISAAANTNLIVGFIPISNNSSLARVFGIPPLEAAVDVLAARIIKRLDLGRVNNNFYFIDLLKIENPQEVIISWGNFQLEIFPGSQADICNIGFNSDLTGGKIFNPRDGRLDVVINANKRGSLPTKLSAKKLKIKDRGQAVTLYLDNAQVVKTPASIEVVPQKARIIVGSDRLFE